jgi:hypothetical protein
MEYDSKERKKEKKKGKPPGTGWWEKHRLESGFWQQRGKYGCDPGWRTRIWFSDHTCAIMRAVPFSSRQYYGTSSNFVFSLLLSLRTWT